MGLREQGQEVELGGEGEGCGRFNVEGIVRGSCLLSVSVTVGDRTLSCPEGCMILMTKAILRNEF